MKRTVKRKVVTSGRLSGGVRVQPAKNKVTPNPGPAGPPEPAYSLYSTDSEDQVTTLHKGLDRCAALLNGILQAEKAEGLMTLPRTVNDGVAKSRSSTSVGKKTTKKLVPKKDQKSCGSVHGRLGSTTLRTHQSSSPAAHSGVKLHLFKKQCHDLLQSSKGQISEHFSPSSSISQSPPVPHADLESAAQAAAPSDQQQYECVPVRDTSTRVTATHSHTKTTKTSDLHPVSGQLAEPCQDSHSSGEVDDAVTDWKLKTVQYLLGELRALIAGQGSVAETLLSHLELTVSSPLPPGAASSPHTASVTDLQSQHSHNIQLRRSVRLLKEQFKEREDAERQQNTQTLSDSDVLTLQGELTSAQSQLQELQEDVTELRKALQNTQSQLRDREAENAVLKTELDSTRSRLQDSVQHKSQLTLVAKQRQEEIEKLCKILHSRDSSHCPTVSDTLLPKQHFQKHQHKLNPARPPTDRISQYLMSLGQQEPTHPEEVCVAADIGDKPEDKRTHSVLLRQLSDPDHLDQSHIEKRRSVSQCDVESVTCDWSVRSESTFDTRDEAAFRDGLAALDASIASLQKTIQMDLVR